MGEGEDRHSSSTIITIKVALALTGFRGFPQSPSTKSKTARMPCLCYCFYDCSQGLLRVYGRKLPTDRRLPQSRRKGLEHEVRTRWEAIPRWAAQEPPEPRPGSWSLSRGLAAGISPLLLAQACSKAVRAACAAAMTSRTALGEKTSRPSCHQCLSELANVLIIRI